MDCAFQLSLHVWFNGYCSCFVASQEMKKKLYGSVLLIGGGFGFSQSSVILQSRLESSLPAQFSKGADTVEVSSNPRVSDK